MERRRSKTELPQSDFLFPSGGYLVGAGSILNLGGSYFEYNSSAAEQTNVRFRPIGGWWVKISGMRWTSLDRKNSPIAGERVDGSSCWGRETTGEGVTERGFKSEGQAGSG